MIWVKTILESSRPESEKLFHFWTRSWAQLIHSSSSVESCWNLHTQMHRNTHLYMLSDITMCLLNQCFSTGGSHTYTTTPLYSSNEIPFLIWLLCFSQTFHNSFWTSVWNVSSAVVGYEDLSSALTVVSLAMSGSNPFSVGSWVGLGSPTSEVLCHPGLCATSDNERKWVKKKKKERKRKEKKEKFAG